MTFLSNFFGKQTQKEHIQLIDKDHFVNGIKQKSAQIVDVRTPNEYNQGHIKGAKNINFFDSIHFMKAINSLNKDQPVYLYCRSGNRSKTAAKLMAKQGFKHLFDLKGGYLNW